VIETSTGVGMEDDFAALRRALSPMAHCPVPYWVAGGWAIDLFLGRITRPHHDVDIVILRRDQAAVRHHLRDWSLHWVEPHPGGRLHSWQHDEWLSHPIHEIHGRHPDGATIELLLNEATGEVWHFRRDKRISRPLHLVARSSPQGISYLATEVVLLYKAQEFRDADAADFASVRDSLDTEQRSWLSAAIAIAHGDHPWPSML
jgi:hypothetical protein